MRLVVFGDDKATAGFFIEAVHYSRPFSSAYPRKRDAMMEQSIDQSMLPLAGAWMNNQTGRFIDDDEIVVFEKDLQRNRFRLMVDLFDRRLGQFDFIAGADEVPRSRGCAIASDEPCPDQVLESRAGVFLEFCRQETIKAKSRRLFRHSDLSDNWTVRRWTRRVGWRLWPGRLGGRRLGHESYYVAPKQLNNELAREMLCRA